MRRSLLIVLLFSALLVPAMASQERALRFRTFRFESSDESGPVVVTGTQNDRGVTALHITSFGKSFTCSPAQLKQLRGLIVNNVQLSGEAGYRGLGGRTLYLVLSMGFTSGLAESKRVTISEERGVTVKNGR
jgi:hypothetical protein